jgi:8-oxo-dGTP pyrophosphatase MutT (NUDIX family)
MPTLEHIAERLATHPPEVSEPEPGARQASVAIILRARASRRRPGQRVTDVLFIRRAEKDGDPWSGHMAFPGGHRDRSDASLLEAALRETREEIGLELDASREFIGALTPHAVQPRMRPIGMHIAPFVFRLDRDVNLALSHEVAEVVWTPLAPIFTGENHTEENRIIDGAPVEFGGYRINGGHFVWGLTYRMLQAFFAVLDPAWRAPASDP